VTAVTVAIERESAAYEKSRRDRPAFMERFNVQRENAAAKVSRQSLQKPARLAAALCNRAAFAALWIWHAPPPSTPA
jgi:hypothetical protein